MNLPNKLTMLRIFMSFVIIAVLLLPFDAMGIEIYKLFINETIVVDVRYLIAGVLFILASLTDFLDGYIARVSILKSFSKMSFVVNKILSFINSTSLFDILILSISYKFVNVTPWFHYPNMSFSFPNFLILSSSISSNIWTHCLIL